MKSPTLDTLKTSQVYAALRARILSGAFSPGSRLILRDLAEELSTSELPVREALWMLKRDGLVEMLPHRGARVARMTLDEVEEALLIRSRLEALATESAIDHLDHKQLKVIEQLLMRLDDALARRDGLAFGDLNKQFHSAIYSASPYERLQQLIDTLWAGQTKFRTVFLLSPPRMEESQAEHRELFELIKARNKSGASMLMVEHKLRTARVLISRLRELERGEGLAAP